jgi:CheY-like chemotaxis protein
MKILKLVLGIAETTSKAAPSQSVLASQSFVQFAQTFRIGPEPRPSTQETVNAGLGAQAALEEFLRATPNTIGSVRKLFSDISSAPTLSARQRILTDICLQLGELKNQLGVFQLRPAWQLASSLEGLFEQLNDNPSQLKLSTLRTAASAVVLLESLCVPGLRRDLVHNPTVRILVVDDDPICCQAVMMSLKAFAPPDFAADGETAIALAAQKPYDIVFLDVELPGTDGYEVCARIRELETNHNTSVIFVTSHSDSESRAKSTASGGKDLIVKPFLSFEVAVKALTLVLRQRLEESKSRHQEVPAAPAFASQVLVAA